MKPDWDKLTEEFADSKYSGIYDVDCTADGKELCDDVGVTGYPTIKYGDPSDRKGLKDYSGGRTFDALKKFAEENLGPVCAPHSMEACEEEEKQQLEGFMQESPATLLEKAKTLQKKHNDVQKKITKSKSKLAEKWEGYYEDKSDHDKIKVKKGQEKKHEEKGAKLEARRAKLQAEQDKLDKDQENLKGEIKTSGVKLMQLAAKAAKDKKEL